MNGDLVGDLGTRQRPSMAVEGPGRSDDLVPEYEVGSTNLRWNPSAAIRGYLRFYMPTSQAVDWLRTPRGLKWAIPVALVATPCYFFAMSVCAIIVERGGPGCCGAESK